MRQTFFALLMPCCLTLAIPADVTAMTYDEAARTSCSSFIAAFGKPDAYERLQDPVTAYLMQRDDRQKLGSSCNMMDYVRAECRRDRTLKVGDAMAILIGKASDGRALPRIAQCGA